MNIYALSSGRGPSGIAIVRISGKDTLRVCKNLTLLKMKFIQNLLLLITLMSFASANKNTTVPLKYFIFREDCLNKFLGYEFDDMECIKFTISKGIGFAIVGGSSILKLPQIIKIINSGSVEGLAPITTYIEVSF